MSRSFGRYSAKRKLRQATERTKGTKDELRTRLPTKKKRNNLRGDFSLLLLPFLLASFGVLAVYSASNYVAKTQYGDAFYFVKKQLWGLACGTAAMLLCARFDCAKLRKKSVYLSALFVPVLLLALVFVPGIGKSNYGATRWIGIGGLTLQPSELAKYGFVLFAAAYMSKRMDEMRTFRGALPVLCAGGAICVLIILEPNMSVTMCVGALMLAMLFLGGMRIRYFVAIGLPLLLAIPVLIIIEPYRLSRLSAFLNPWASPRGEGYQLIQSLYALGNGGWFGTGLFRSRQKYRFLPFAESDFILSVIGEETGFVGICALFFVCGLLVYRGIRAARRADDFFSYLLAVGITLVYGIQTALNALVVSGSIPPTGLPLPLISAGNTSLIITMASMGVLYSVSARGKPITSRRRTKNGEKYIR